MTPRQRVRAFAVVAAVSIVSSVGVAWGSVPDEDGTIHACYRPTSGSVRIIDPPQTSCGKGEVALSWGTGGLADGSVTTAKLADDAVTSGKIKDGEVGTSDLAGLGVTTGKLADESVTFAKLAPGAVQGTAPGTLPPAGNTLLGTITGESTPVSGATGNLGLKTVAWGNLADDSVRGGLNGVVQDGSITSFDLAPGSVGANELQPGSVSTMKQTANGATGLSLTGTIPDGASADVGNVALILTDAGSQDHLVMITGQLNLACPTCSLTPGTVTYQLYVTDGSTTEAVGQPMIASTSQGQSVVLPLSGLDDRGSAPGGKGWTYFVRASASAGLGAVNVVNVAIDAVDLGRS